jgi:hypothetical protein
MGIYVSSGSRVAFGRETTFGTKATTNRKLGIIHQGFELPDLQREVRAYKSFGVGRRMQNVVQGRNERTATIPVLPTSGEMFYYAFGKNNTGGTGEDFTVDTPSAGINQHVMSPQNLAELPSFSLGVALEGSPNFLRTFTGCSVNQLQVSLSEASELQMSLDIMAKDTVDWDSASPTLFARPDLSGIRPYMFYDRAANVTIGGTYNYTTNAMTGGRTFAQVKGFNMSLNNNLKAHWFSQDSTSIDTKDPFVFTTGYPEFDLTMEITPRGKLGGTPATNAGTDLDAIYDLLEEGVRGDILIPFQKSATDKLHFVFDDCMIRTAGHGLNDDGNDVTVQVSVQPSEFRVIAYDAITAYSAL